MPYRDDDCPKSRMLLLMDITSSLACFTQRTEGVAQIPAYLKRVFRLQGVSLAIVDVEKKDPVILLGAHSDAPVPESFARALINIHQQTIPHLTQQGPTVRASIELAASDAAEGGAFSGQSRAMVFAHQIDPDHRMLLVIHQLAGDPALSAPLTETLQLVAQQLGKLLESVVIWLTCPELLGGNFERLTDREWIVLRYLNSEAGEKQLADQLGLSPHTLHSHIKAIYRKVGVQGRLPLLLRVERALQALRLHRLETPKTGSSTGAADRNANAA
jgi:DNA-binding CsgD family transcriptional regulator